MSRGPLPTIRLGGRPDVVLDPEVPPAGRSSGGARRTQGGEPPVERRVVTGAGLPQQIGPYSHAVAAGGFLFVSGQPGIDPGTGEPVGPTFEDQARQAFANLEAVLREGGSRPDLVVSTTVLVADQADFVAMNDLFAAFFPTAPPTRMTMQVPLPHGLRFSIGCTAVLADGGGAA